MQHTVTSIKNYMILNEIELLSCARVSVCLCIWMSQPSVTVMYILL